MARELCDVCGGEITKGRDDVHGVWDCPAHCRDLSWGELADQIKEQREEIERLHKLAKSRFMGLDMRRDTIKLLGGYMCELTVAERNKWHEWIRKQEAFKVLVEARVCYAVGIMHGDKAMAAAHTDEAATQRVYDLAKGWYEELLKRRAQ